MSDRVWTEGGRMSADRIAISDLQDGKRTSRSGEAAAGDQTFAFVFETGETPALLPEFGYRR